MANWLILVEMISAAHELDARRFTAASGRLQDEPSVDATAFRFTYYLLKQTIGQRVPSPVRPDPVRILARDITPSVTRLAQHVGERDIAIVMLTAVGFVKKEHLPTQEFVIVLGSIILGDLLENPQEDLETLRPGLMDWYAQTYATPQRR